MQAYYPLPVNDGDVAVRVHLSFQYPKPEDAYPERRIVLNREKPSVVIGRASQRQLRIPAIENCLLESPVISRDHAEIFVNFEAKTVCIRDENSRHGTFLNHDRVFPGHPHVLTSGNTLRFGTDIQREANLFAPPSAVVELEFLHSDDLAMGNQNPPQRSFGYRAPDPLEDSDDESSDEDRAAVREAVRNLRRAGFKRAPKLPAEAPEVEAEAEAAHGNHGTDLEKPVLIDLDDEDDEDEYTTENGHRNESGSAARIDTIIDLTMPETCHSYAPRALYAGTAILSTQANTQDSEGQSILAAQTQAEAANTPRKTYLTDEAGRGDGVIVGSRNQEPSSLTPIVVDDADDGLDDNHHDDDILDDLNEFPILESVADEIDISNAESEEESVVSEDEYDSDEEGFQYRTAASEHFPVSPAPAPEQRSDYSNAKTLEEIPPRLRSDSELDRSIAECEDRLRECRRRSMDQSLTQRERDHAAIPLSIHDKYTVLRSIKRERYRARGDKTPPWRSSARPTVDVDEHTNLQDGSSPAKLPTPSPNRAEASAQQQTATQSDEPALERGYGHLENQTRFPAMDSVWSRSGDEFLSSPPQENLEIPVQDPLEPDMTSAFCFQQSKLALAPEETQSSAALIHEAEPSYEHEELSITTPRSPKRKADQISDLVDAEAAAIAAEPGLSAPDHSTGSASAAQFDVGQTMAVDPVTSGTEQEVEAIPSNNIPSSNIPSSNSLSSNSPSDLSQGTAETRATPTATERAPPNGRPRKRFRSMAEAAGLMALGAAGASVAIVSTLIASAPNFT